MSLQVKSHFRSFVSRYSSSVLNVLAGWFCRSRYYIYIYILIIIYIKYNLAFLLTLFPTGIQTNIGESTKEKAHRQNPLQKASKIQKVNSYWTLYQLISSIAPAFALWKGWSWNIKIKLRVGAGSVVRSLFVRFATMCCCLSKSIGHHGYVILRGLVVMFLLCQLCKVPDPESFDFQTVVSQMSPTVFLGTLGWFHLKERCRAQQRGLF